MRIALVAPGGLHPSGREQVVPVWLWLIERLARRHEVHAFVLRHLARPVSYPLAGAMVHDLGRPGAGHGPAAPLSAYRALVRAVRGAGPFDVLHGLRGTPAGVLAALAGRRLGIPALVTFDSGELVALPEIGYGLQRTWRGRGTVALATRAATRVHVTSDDMARRARHLGIDATCVPLGVDLTRVPTSPRPPDRPPWRLLQVASLNPVKDQRTLLDALALASRHVDISLDLAGEDTLHGELQRHAALLGVTDRVVFHGFVAHDALPPLRARAHAYVQSSRHEAASIAVLEAAAAGLPIVGTGVGYLADWAPAAATAVDAGNPSALAQAIVDLLHDADRRRTQAAAAHLSATQHDADYSAHEVEGLYTRLSIEDCRLKIED